MLAAFSVPDADGSVVARARQVGVHGVEGDLRDSSAVADEEVFFGHARECVFGTAGAGVRLVGMVRHILQPRFELHHLLLKAHNGCPLHFKDVRFLLRGRHFES